jgi:hypothetical protein
MANFDLNILGDLENDRSLLDVDNTAVTGVAKLVQRILVFLFKDNENPNNLGFGTNLPRTVFSANVQNEEVLKNTFQIAADRAIEALRQTTPTAAPLDEQVDKIEVEIQEAESRDTVDVLLTVSTLAGDTRTIKVPLSDPLDLDTPDEELPVLGG